MAKCDLCDAIENRLWVCDVCMSRELVKKDQEIERLKNEIEYWKKECKSKEDLYRKQLNQLKKGD